MAGPGGGLGLAAGVGRTRPGSPRPCDPTFGEEREDLQRCRAKGIGDDNQFFPGFTVLPFGSVRCRIPRAWPSPGVVLRIRVLRQAFHRVSVSCCRS